MKLYRAMCLNERNKTISNKIASFDIKRFKWFSHNLEWIKSRVQDGKFNNSKFKNNRYKYLLEFEAIDNKYDFISKNEIQFDRRKNPTIKFIREIS